MLKVFKYKLPFDSKPEPLFLPVGAKILGITVQHNTPCLYALVNSEIHAVEPRYFNIYYTGSEIERDPQQLVFIGTFVSNNLVYHCFEIIL